MGLYYNPPSPNVGNQQPLEPRKLTPSSGPAPQNPPFIGATINQAILIAWAIPVAAIVLPQLLVPQPVQAAASIPARALSQEIYRNWEVPPPAPIVARLLNPPISGPTPQNPPLIGTPVQIAIQSWSVVPLAVGLPQLLIPQPANAIQPQRLPQEIYTSWLPPAPAPIVAVNLNPPQSGPIPQNPPVIGAVLPLPVQVSWMPPPPAPIVAVNLDPPISGPAPQNPPIIGSLIPLAVQVSWLPPAPAPIVAINLDPPIAGPAPQNPPVVGSRLPLEIQIGWIAPPPAPIVGPELVFLPPASTNPPFNGGAKVSGEVLIGWLPPQPAPIFGPKFTQGAPAPQNPPFAGTRTPLEVRVGLIPPPPMPTLNILTTPPTGPAVNFIFTVSGDQVIEKFPHVGVSHPYAGVSSRTQ